MRTRRLGNNHLEMSAMGLGCWAMSHAYGPADEKESLATTTKKTAENGGNSCRYLIGDFKSLSKSTKPSVALISIPIAIPTPKGLFLGHRRLQLMVLS